MALLFAGKALTKKFVGSAQAHVSHRLQQKIFD
jgi:hypothetical protein